MPETPDGTDNDAHFKNKNNKDNKKKHETKHIRKFQPVWLKEFELVVFIFFKQIRFRLPCIGFFF